MTLVEMAQLLAAIWSDWDVTGSVIVIVVRVSVFAVYTDSCQPRADTTGRLTNRQVSEPARDLI